MTYDTTSARAHDATLAVSVAPSDVRTSIPAGDMAPVLAERFELRAFLGGGGMGAVYRAHDLYLDEDVAVKVIRADLDPTPKMLDMFRREVRNARRVTHPNIARMYDLGRHESTWFLTMELVEGETLDARVAREGRLPVHAVVDIALRIADGLAAAHRVGIVHRDMKPENVLLSRDGRVLLTDFGVAHCLADARQDGLVGTPVYMAPEQVTQDVDLDGRADLYALGVMLYELVTGVIVWERPDLTATLMARFGDVPDPRAHAPSLLPALASLITRCMAVSREHRYSSAESLAVALREVRVRLSDASWDGATITAQRPWVAPERARGRAVVVLPPTSDRVPAHMLDAIADELVDALSEGRALKVRRVPDLAAAHAAGAQVVVSGTVSVDVSSLTATFRATTADDGFQFWSRRLTTASVRPAALARAVARDLAKHLDAPGVSSTATPDVEDPETLDLYLRARHELRSFRHGAMETALRCLDAAIERRPQDPAVRALMAIARVRWAFSADDDLGLAQDAVSRATLLAPMAPETRLAHGFLLMQLGDLSGAVRELHPLLSIPSTQADACWLVGRVLAESGLDDEAEPLLAHACRLAPDQQLAWFDRGRIHALRGDWHTVEALAAEQGDGGRWVERARKVSFTWDADLAREVLANLPPDYPVARGYAVLLRIVIDGRVERVGWFAAPPPPTATARKRQFYWQTEMIVRAGFRDREGCLAALESAVIAGFSDILWIDRYPLFDFVRDDPRFAAVRAAVGQRAAEVVRAWQSLRGPAHPLADEVALAAP